MDNLENQSVTPETNGNSIQAQLDSLRKLIVAALVLIFLVAGAINIYFMRQLRAVRSELTPLRQQGAQITAEVNKINSAANEFARRLLEYSKTHPDFVPILNKYNIREMPATNAAATATIPNAAVPAVPKK